MKPNYSYSNAIVETKRIQKPDLAIRIAWIGLAGTFFCFWLLVMVRAIRPYYTNIRCVTLKDIKFSFVSHP